MSIFFFEKLNFRKIEISRLPGRLIQKTLHTHFWAYFGDFGRVKNLAARKVRPREFLIARKFRMIFLNKTQFFQLFD